MAKKTELEIAQENLAKAEANLKAARAEFQEAHNKSLTENPQMSNFEIRKMMEKVGVKSESETVQAALAKLKGAKL
jgi:outer membrane protein TolC